MNRLIIVVMALCCISCGVHKRAQWHVNRLAKLQPDRLEPEIIPYIVHDTVVIQEITTDTLIAYRDSIYYRDSVITITIVKKDTQARLRYVIRPDTIRLIDSVNIECPPQIGTVTDYKFPLWGWVVICVCGIITILALLKS